MTIDFAALDQKLGALCEEAKLPGAAVAIAGPEGILFQKGYGRRDEAGTPIDADTMLGVASMSKSMVSLAICLLEAEGKLSWDDPVTKYFPQFRVRGAARDAVTLKTLAMHRAGIPPMEPLEWSIAMNTPGRENEWARKMRASAPNKMETIEQIVDYIAQSDYRPLGAPGEVMSYCNEGYAILSYVVDQAAGLPLEDFLQRRVFDPLGMTRSVIDVDCQKARALAGGNITSLFETEDGKLVADDDWSVLPPFRGCAMVKSTARDMATYYQCLSAGGAAAERLVGREFPTTERPYYCLGLTKRAFQEAVICEHSGGLHGVSSCGAFLKDGGYGFSVLCNHGDKDVSPLMRTLINAALGQPLDRSHEWAKPLGRAFSDPEMILGAYVGREGEPSRLLVTMGEDGLRGAREEIKTELVYCGGTFFLGMREGKVAERYEFHIREGRAWGASVGSRVFQREE